MAILNNDPTAILQNMKFHHNLLPSFKIENWLNNIFQLHIHLKSLKQGAHTLWGWVAHKQRAE
jgi:hypothetical protein